MLHDNKYPVFPERTNKGRRFEAETRHRISLYKVQPIIILSYSGTYGMSVRGLPWGNENYGFLRLSRDTISGAANETPGE